MSFLRLIALITLCLWISSVALPVAASDIQKELAREAKRVQQAQGRMQKLTDQERALHKDLAATEQRIKKLAADVAAREADLSGLERRDAELDAELGELEARRDDAEESLKRLLKLLWPLDAGEMASRLAGVGSWPEADRRFTWLSAVYARAQGLRAEIDAKTRELAKGRDELERLRTRAETRLAEVNTAKDELLAARLKLAARVRTVRNQRVEARQKLAEIIETVQQLNYQLKQSRKAKPKPKAKAPKGDRPWPAKGKVVAEFDPRATPPNRGLGMAVGAGAAVQAVSWGKVVHADLLRGFGNVVVLLHENDHYSLYAFLADMAVRVGQQVERGESLGKAGFYPPAEGPGLYFELRSGQKAINPYSWLSR